MNVVCVCEGGYELWLTSAAENYSMMEIVNMKISDSELLICTISCRHAVVQK